MKNCLRDNHSRLNGVDYTKFEEVHPSRNNLSSIQGNRKLTFLHAQWKIFFWRIQGVAQYGSLLSPAHQVNFFLDCCIILNSVNFIWLCSYGYCRNIYSTVTDLGHQIMCQSFLLFQCKLLDFYHKIRSMIFALSYHLCS